MLSNYWQGFQFFSTALSAPVFCFFFCPLSLSHSSSPFVLLVICKSLCTQKERHSMTQFYCTVGDLILIWIYMLVLVWVSVCLCVHVWASEIYHGKATLSQTSASAAWLHGLFIHSHWMESFFAALPLSFQLTIMIMSICHPRVVNIALSQISYLSANSYVLPHSLPCEWFLSGPDLKPLRSSFWSSQTGGGLWRGYWCDHVCVDFIRHV